MEITPEKLKEWNEKYGEFNKLELEVGGGKIAIYLRKLESLKNYYNTMSRAISFVTNGEEVEAGELVLRACYLGGAFGEKLIDYNKDTPEFLSACFHCSKLITVQSGNFTTT